jgi:hypothetical protein
MSEVFSIKVGGFFFLFFLGFSFVARGFSMPSILFDNLCGNDNGVTNGVIIMHTLCFVHNNKHSNTDKSSSENHVVDKA